MPKFLLTVFILFASLTLQAQTWEIGLSGGGAGYMGDLNQHNPLQISGLSAGAFIKRNFDGYLGLKGSLTYGKIAAADSNSNNRQLRDRNLSFYNKMFEGSLVGEFNFMHYIPDAGKNRWTPFIYAGVGLTWHAPVAIFNNGNSEASLRPLRTEGQKNEYSQYLIAIPYGAGIKYNIGGTWTLMADLGYRYTNTDYLDDVSGLYPQKSALPQTGKNAQNALLLYDRSGERTHNYIGTPGTQRGDLRTHDQYLFLNISISFTFVPERCYYEQ